MFARLKDVQLAPRVLSKKGLLGRKITRSKANRVPAIKASRFPNKTPNLYATALGARGRRRDGGPGRSGERPGRGFGVRTWLHVPADSRGFMPSWGGA